MAIINGRRAVREALESGQTLDRIVIAYSAKRNVEIQKLITMAQYEGVDIQFIPNLEFDQRIPESRHAQGIAAYFSGLKTHTIDDIIEAKPQLVVMLDHIQDPHNFGAIIRSCETFGVTHIVYPKDRNARITPGVIKASAGAIHHVDLVQVTNLASAVRELKENGFWIYAADSNNGKQLPKVTPNFPMVLVMGNEEKGVSKGMLKQCDEAILIPMSGQIASLNVSVAAGIFLYALTQTV